MAEIPAFQEIQDTGITAIEGHPSLTPYLSRKVATLREGLVVEMDGRRLMLDARWVEVIFPPGAGGLATLKLGVVFRSSIEVSGQSHRVTYQDKNYADRIGWKEIIAVAGSGVALRSATVPATDRSRELSDYPTDLLNAPPQDLEAQVVFARAGVPVAAAQPPASGGEAPREPVAGPAARRDRPSPGSATATLASKRTIVEAPRAEYTVAPAPPPMAPEPAKPHAERLPANRQNTPSSRFTNLVATEPLGGVGVFIALAVAAGLGAFHALEPGHGKTIVAAYLVGSRGTGRHAVFLGLVVTAAHTAGVYLLGGITLYASRYVVPERIYPWLGVLSGLTIAGLGLVLFLRRYAGHDVGHSHLGGPHGPMLPHDHGGAPHEHEVAHRHAHAHAHAGRHGHAHAHAHVHESAGRSQPRGDRHPHRWHHEHAPAPTASVRELFVLGVTGGIVPCPAALVVLLSAVALGRVGFGLLLIVAFSVGLAAVLIAVGLLMVYARHVMASVNESGPLVTRWLPLTSAAVIASIGFVITIQALMSAGIVQIRL